MASRRPESVKIGAWRYRIVPWRVEASISANRSGECCNLDKVIRIRSTLEHKRAADVLLHEILHAIWWVWNLHDGDDQERNVATMTDGLHTVIHDNPEVFLWIIRGMRL